MDKTTIMNRIKSRRKDLRLTQLELAQEIGVSLMTIVRWEKGERSPNIAIMPKLAEALDTSIAYLMGLDDAEKMKAQKQELLALAEGIANEEIDIQAPISAGMDKNNIIINDWCNKRTYYIPNNEEGRKLFLSVLTSSLKGAGSALVSNNITGDNNSDIKQGIVNN